MQKKVEFIEHIDLWGIISGDIAFDSYKTGSRHVANFALDAFAQTTK